jgi:acyl-CoA synthetase (AMP-forming)/AMP-acid ligase II
MKINFNQPLANITQLETGVTLDPQQFRNLVNLKCEELKKLSIVPGSSVLLFNPNSIDFFVNLLAVFSLGATIIPIDPQASELEIKNIIKHAGVNILLKENSIEKINSALNEELKNIALVMYTSGTTGTPKGVKLSYSAIISKIEVLSNQISMVEREHILCFLPTFFGHGLICNSLFALFFSDRFTIAKKMDLRLASTFKEILNQNKITFFSSVPAAWDLILNFNEESDTTLSFLKRVHCASAFLQNEKAAFMQSWLGKDVSLYNIFGITELSGWVAQRKIAAGEDANVFSEFWNAEIKYNDDGELLIRSPYMFSGYLTNPDETALALSKDGYFNSGDIFSDFRFTGRARLVINKKGCKVYPNELDEFLMASGMILDCHTFAIKDNFAGELIGILIVLKDGYTNENVRSYCLSGLAPVKFPDRIFEVPKIERTSRGKIALQSLEKYKGEAK